MNTFLPYYDFYEIAKCLDKRRLFKQVIEAKQIIDILTTGKTNNGNNYPLSMKHHPIVKAWSKNIPALVKYYNTLLDYLPVVGIRTKMVNIGIIDQDCKEFTNFELPSWLNADVCRMYQAHLMRKDTTHYKFNVDPTIPFDWSLLKL